MKSLCRICIFVLLVSCSFTAVSQAASWQDRLRYRQSILEPYFAPICAKYGIPQALALAIARQESGLNPLVINVSGKDYHPRNMSEALALARQAMELGRGFDVGLMQVNVYWIKRHKLPLELVLDPVSNIEIGMWILAQEVKRHGLNWRAVAYYHTPLHKNPERGRNYAASVMRHMQRILAEQG